VHSEVGVNLRKRRVRPEAVAAAVSEVLNNHERSADEDAERVTGGVGENVQRLILVYGPVE
jgi:hypothetical protein